MITGALVILPGAARGADYEPNVLYVGLQQDTPDFNMWNLGTNNVNKQKVLSWGFESIMGIDFDSKPYPLLAESWVFDEGTLTVDIVLRQGVLFHDGYEMTADDVYFTYLMARDGTAYSSNIINAFDSDSDGMVSEAELAAGVQVDGTYGIRMTMAHPYGQFFAVTLGVPIMPRHIWESHVDFENRADVTWSDPLATIGTGPFAYSEGIDSEYRIIDRFEDYWGVGFYTPCGFLRYPVDLEKVHFKFYPASEDAVAALEGGAIDLIGWALAPSLVPDLQDNPDIDLEYMADAAYFYLAFNMKKEPMNNLTFRKAVSHLIDKDQIVDVYMGGLGMEGSAAIPPYFGEWFNAAVTKYPYDETIAGQMLDEAGFVDVNGDGWRDLPDGSTIDTITLLTPPEEYDSIRYMAGQMVAASMVRSGINTVAVAIDFSTLVAKLTAYDYEMLMLGWRFTGYSECVSVLFDIYSPLSASNSWAFWSETNPSPWYSDLGGVSTLADEATQAYADEFLDLEDQARASFDANEQINLVKQGQEIIADAIPCNVLYYRVNVEAHSRTWTNWTVSDGTVLNSFTLAHLYSEPYVDGVVEATGVVNAGLSVPGEVLLGGFVPAQVVAIDQTGAPIPGATVNVTVTGMEGDATVHATPSFGAADGSGVFSFDITGDSAGHSTVTVGVYHDIYWDKVSEDIECVAPVPHTLALSISPTDQIMLAGESTDIVLTATDENGDPVENALVAVDTGLIVYGSVSSASVVTDSSGEAQVTYYAPPTIVMTSAHETDTLAFTASADGFDRTTSAVLELLVFNDAEPDWLLTSIVGVTTTALTGASNTTSITVLATDDEGAPLAGHWLDVSYSDEEKVFSPVATVLTDGTGQAVLDVQLKDSGSNFALTVSICDGMVPNSVGSEVTLTYLDSAPPADEMYGGYVSYSMAQFLGPLGSIDVTFNAWDSAGNPADGVTGNVVVSGTSYGQIVQFPEAEYDSAWDYSGINIVTSADSRNIVTMGQFAMDYSEWGFFGVTLTGGQFTTTLTGVSVTHLDVVCDIFMVVGGAGTYDWNTFNYRIDGQTTIASEYVYGRAEGAIQAQTDIQNPVMIARDSSYDSSVVALYAFDESGNPVEGAEVTVRETLTTNVNYIVEPNTDPRFSDPVTTDASGYAEANIVAIPPTYIPTGVSIAPYVYVTPDYPGSLALVNRYQIAILLEPCFVELMPLPDVLTAGEIVYINATVTDAAGTPIAGASVELVPGAGTLLDPVVITDAEGVASFELDTAELATMAAGFIPVTAYADAVPYATSTAHMMVPVLGTGAPGPTAVDGYVTDAYTGDPVEDAFVELNSLDYNYWTYTDSSGYYYIDLEPDTYWVWVDHSDYLTFDGEVEAIEGATVHYDVELSPWAQLETMRLYGYVNDSDTGAGIPDAVVVAMDAVSYSWMNYTYSNGTGYYEMYALPIILDLAASSIGYNTWEGQADCTGLTELRFDIEMTADPYEPDLTLDISPDTNVSELNPLNAHFTAQDSNLFLVELLIMRLWNTTEGGSNYTFVDGYAAFYDWDPDWIDFPFSFENDTFTGDIEWSASSDRNGWLSDATTTEYVSAYAHRSIMGDESYGLLGYYSNDTVTDELGFAWFDNITHEFEEFEFDSGLPTAFIPDPTGMLDPAEMIYPWHEGMTIWDLNVSPTRLGMRSVIGLTFEYDELAPSGDYSAWVVGGDFAMNINFTKADFTVDTDPPVADAGEDRSITAGTTITLDGTGSSDNVGITSYEWTIARGTTTETVYGESTDYTFSSTGTYTVTLTVTDGAGHEASDSATVLVTAIVDELPTADAGDDQTVDEDTVMTFDGTDSSDDHVIDNYTWTIEELDAEMYGAEPEYTFAQPGTYHVTLVVTDNASQVSDPDEMVVTVTDVTAPTADAGDDVSVIAGATVTFDGSESADNVGVDSYTWTFDDGGAQTLSGVEPTYTFENEGDFTITLTVLDAETNSDTDEVVVHVFPEDAAPTADAGGDQAVTIGDTVTFDGTGSTDDGGAGDLNYTWTFEYDGETVTRYGADAEFTFEIAGEYIVTLTVEDEDGLTDEDTMTVTVEEKGTSFIEQYWWTLALVAAIVVVALALFMLMRKKKAA
jgi:ABC-type transport system substrate-binding protein/PKD repeat protein/protocatechuate 3,4-dioxygenase beta subunit